MSQVDERRRPGRPLRADAPANKRVEFVITPEERQALVRVAQDAGKPLATVIREAVNEYVSDYTDRVVFIRL